MTDPLAGEAHGQHTPAAMQRLIAYLEQATGAAMRAHGSVSRGETSANDFDIIIAARTEAEMEDDAEEANLAAANIWERHCNGELTEHEAMQTIYGDAPDPLADALAAIGFTLEHSVAFDGSQDGRAGAAEVCVTRFVNSDTAHGIEIWMQA